MILESLCTATITRATRLLVRIPCERRRCLVFRNDDVVITILYHHSDGIGCIGCSEVLRQPEAGIVAFHRGDEHAVAESRRTILTKFLQDPL